MILSNEQIYSIQIVIARLIEQEVEGKTLFKVYKLAKQLDQLVEPLIVSLQQTEDESKRLAILEETQEANLITLDEEDIEQLTLRPMDLLALEPILEGVNELANFE